MENTHPPFKGSLFRDTGKTDSFGDYFPSGTVEEVTADLPHRAEQLGAKYGELYRLDKDGNPEGKPIAMFGAEEGSAPAAARRGRKPGSSPAPAADVLAAEEASSAAENASSSSESAPARGRKPGAPPAAPKRRGRKPSNAPKK